MHPSPIADTVNPCLPNFLNFMAVLSVRLVGYRLWAVIWFQSACFLSGALVTTMRNPVKRDSVTSADVKETSCPTIKMAIADEIFLKESARWVL
jgi:hypothetical protein